MEEDHDKEFTVVAHSRRNASTKRKRTDTGEDHGVGGLGHLMDMVLSGNAGKANKYPITREGGQYREPPLKKIRMKITNNSNIIGEGTSTVRPYPDEGESGESNP